MTHGDVAGCDGAHRRVDDRTDDGGPARRRLEEAVEPHPEELVERKTTAMLTAVRTPAVSGALRTRSTEALIAAPPGTPPIAADGIAKISP